MKITRFEKKREKNLFYREVNCFVATENEKKKKKIENNKEGGKMLRNFKR